MAKKFNDKARIAAAETALIETYQQATDQAVMELASALDDLFLAIPAVIAAKTASIVAATAKIEADKISVN